MTRHAPDPTADSDDSHAQLGRYTLLERIGEGGMAQVFKARATGIEGFEKIVVIKRILPEHARNKAFIDMLIAEAKVCSVLDHPNIVAIHELGASGDVYYIVMEYAGETDLLRLLKDCGDKGRTVPIEIALYIINEIAQGLAYAHRATDHAGRPLNIVHRDVSPANVIVSNDGIVKLTDFGVARADMGRSPVARRSESLRGKLSYLSPEIATGQPIDHRSDVFALGTLLWESLTLKRLFMGRSHAATLANVRDVRVARRFKRHDYLPQGVQKIIDRALQREPSDRFPTALAMSEAIQDYLFNRRLRVSGRSVAAFIRSVREGAALAEPTTSLRDLPGAAGAGAGGKEDPDTLIEVARPKQAQKTTRAYDPHGDTTIQEALPAAMMSPEVDALLVDLEGEMSDRLATKSRASIRTTQPNAKAAAHGHLDTREEDGGRPLRDNSVIRIRNESELFGPISLTELDHLLRHGAVGTDEEVSVDGGGWVRLSQSEVKRLKPELFVDEGRVVWHGRLERAWLPRLFFQLSARKVNGLLRLSRGWVRKDLYYRRGSVIHVNSNLRDELLATRLERDGLITGVQVDASLTRSKTRDIQLGQALIETKTITPGQLEAALQQQLDHRFIELFSWRRGSFTFFEGVDFPSHAGDKLIEGLSLTGRAVRSHYGAAELEQLFEPYLSWQIVPAKAPPVEVSSLGLEASEEDAAGAAVEAQTVAAFLSRSRRPAAREAALRALFIMQQADIVQLRAPETAR